MKRLTYILAVFVIYYSANPAVSQRVMDKSDTTSLDKVTKIYSLPTKDSAKVLLQNKNTTAVTAHTDSVYIKKPDEIWDWLFNVLKNIFGVWILIVFGILIVLWKIWKDREHIKAFALKICSLLPRTIPKTDINKFSVLIAKLENDQDSKMCSYFFLL